jgi:hypothetical protein
METPFLIPLINLPQTFQIVLAGLTYLMTSKWNDADGGGWLLDIADQNDNPIACNIPLITGADCLEGLEYLGIQGQMYVNSSGTDSTEVPTLSNLGTDSFLYFVTSVPNG